MLHLATSLAARLRGLLDLLAPRRADLIPVPVRRDERHPSRRNGRPF